MLINCMHGKCIILRSHAVIQINLYFTYSEFLLNVTISR